MASPVGGEVLDAARSSSRGARLSSLCVAAPETRRCGYLFDTTGEHRILANPMADLVGREAAQTHRLFHHYKTRFGKSYGGEWELEHRKHVFTHNMR